MNTAHVQYSDQSHLPALVTAYQMVDDSLKGLAIVKNCRVVLNRFYYDNNFFMFNFSVFLKGKECKYLLSFPCTGGKILIRSSKWNGNSEIVDTTDISFGKFIRTGDF